MFRSFISAVLLFSVLKLSAQASLATMGVPYTQDFNSLTAGSDAATYPGWTNNTTLAGWYGEESAGAADDLPIIEASYTTMANGGSLYIYRNAGDVSFGSRAAGSTNTCYYGLRLVNNTGSTITSLYVDYYGEQWTIAENNSNINTNAFSYQTAATVTSLTAGSWTNFTGLDFTQIYNSTQSAGMGGTACGGTSNQCLALNGNSSANRVHITGCITVTIPAGNEIMLRWTDIDNAANDHHLQIDDLAVWPFDVACSIILPVELTKFEARVSADDALLNWETASEKNNSHFNIERAGADGIFQTIGRVEGNGTSTQMHQYQFSDENLSPGFYYYRLNQIDFNGANQYSQIRVVEVQAKEAINLNIVFAENEYSFLIEGETGNQNQIEIWSATGQLIYAAAIGESKRGFIPVPDTDDIYFVRLVTENGAYVKTILR